MSHFREPAELADRHKSSTIVATLAHRPFFADCG